MNEPRPSKGWKNADGSVSTEMWEVDIRADAACIGEYIIYKTLSIICLGECEFHGNPNGYWNGALYDFMLLPDETITLVYAV